MIKLIASERGAAIISAIYVMVILTIMGFGVMALTTNEGRMIAGERKSNQALTIAESGAEHMTHRFAIGVASGGVTPDYTNAPVDMSVAQALDSGKYLSYNVLDSTDNVIGKAKIVVQAAASTPPGERRITSHGQFCLDPACTNLSRPRVIQTVISAAQSESANVAEAFDYLLYAGNGGGAFWLREMYLQGNVYFQRGTTLEFDHATTYIGTMRSHESLRNDDCEGSMGQAIIYSFNSIACTYYQQEWPNYNGGNYNANFPEVTVDAPLNRDWYKQNSDKYFPADAATNPSASQSIFFCSNANGEIFYQDINSGCSYTNRLNDSAGNAMTSGVVFVAGNVKVTGMMAGNIAFVAAGPNSATPGYNTFGTMTVSGNLYSKDTVTGLPSPTCSGTARAGVAGSTDVIGLVSRTVSLSAGGCQTIRAVIRSVNGLGSFERTSSNMYFRGSMLFERPTSTDIRGEESYPWSIRLYYDPQVAANLPRGMAGGFPANGSSVTLDRRSYSEIYLR